MRSTIGFVRRGSAGPAEVGAGMKRARRTVLSRVWKYEGSVCVC
jgi:hypothetical protein